MIARRRYEVGLWMGRSNSPIRAGAADDGAAAAWLSVAVDMVVGLPGCCFSSLLLELSQLGGARREADRQARP